MKEEVIKIIASVAEVPEESINLNTNLINGLCSNQSCCK